jgi:hypothetical protein
MTAEPLAQSFCTQQHPCASAVGWQASPESLSGVLSPVGGVTDTDRVSQAPTQPFTATCEAGAHVTPR